jgi:hypothetical protein
MTLSRVIAVLLLPMLLGAGQFSEQIERGQTKRAGGPAQSYSIRLLPPASFPWIPLDIRTALESRDCLIPQTYQAHSPENVIQGSFRQRGSSDWAILCSHSGSSTLLIFFDGSKKNPAEIITRQNEDMTAVHDLTGVLGFAWGIDPARPLEIKAHSGNKPSGPFDHDGVEDAFLEKGSIIHYFKDGKWLVLEGSD